MGAQWQTFFSALVGAAVTAFAVLLATLQLTAGRWRGQQLKEVVAVLALIDLLVPLLAGLVALMPGTSWRVGYLVMGGVGLCGLVWHASTYLRQEKDTDEFDDRQVQWGLPVSLGVYVSVLAFSCSPANWSIYVVAGLSVFLVFSGSGHVWLLLCLRAEKTATRPDAVVPIGVRPLPPGRPAPLLPGRPASSGAHRADQDAWSSPSVPTVGG